MTDLYTAIRNQQRLTRELRFVDYPRATPEQVQRICDMVDRGCTIAVIRAELGVNYSVATEVRNIYING